MTSTWRTARYADSTPILYVGGSSVAYEALDLVPDRVVAVASVADAVVAADRVLYAPAGPVGMASVAGPLPSVAVTLAASTVSATATVGVASGKWNGTATPSRVTATTSVPLASRSLTVLPSVVSAVTAVPAAVVPFAVARVDGAASVESPTVSLSRTATPSVPTGTVAVFEPTIAADYLLLPPLVSVQAEVYGVGWDVPADILTSTVDVFTPDVAAYAVASAPRVNASSSVGGPTVGGTRTVLAPALTLYTVMVQPLSRRSTGITASLIAATSSVYSPAAVKATGRPRPATVAISAEIMLPGMVHDATAAPSPVDAVVEVGAPTVSLSRTAVPSGIDAVASVFSPDVSGSSAPTFGILTGTVEVYEPVPAYDGTLTPDLVVGTVNLSDPLVVLQIIEAVRVDGSVTFLRPTITPRFGSGQTSYDVLSAAEIACMRDTVEDYMPDEVVIYRRSEVPDGMGSMIRTWVALDSVRGRIAPMGVSSTGGEQLAGGAVIARSSWTLAVPHGTGVLSSDRVLVNGFMHEVGDVIEARSWELYLQVRLTRIDPA